MPSTGGIAVQYVIRSRRTGEVDQAICAVCGTGSVSSGGGSTSSAYEPVIVTGLEGGVNFVGGFINAVTSEINGGMWTSAGGMAYMHICGNLVPQMSAIPIWGDYDTFKYSSWIGSSVGVAASFVLGGPGVAAVSGRALATTSKATSKTAEATRALGQNGSRAASSVVDEALTSVDDALKGLAKGRSAGVRTVDSNAELDELYATLTRGGTPFDVPGYKGVWIERTDGIRIGLRDASKSGGRTIDIRYPDGTTGKVHIE